MGISFSEICSEAQFCKKRCKNKLAAAAKTADSTQSPAKGASRAKSTRAVETTILQFWLKGEIACAMQNFNFCADFW
ncbi:hypothetical protein V8J88_13490 [Massilia sp. W12]|uniref:hypothetical protein n=1 Tax=Massilia sp. W12 TaxID=3126507 RepID=UPI0030D4F8B9